MRYFVIQIGTLLSVNAARAAVDADFISIPLIPHEVQRRRLRQELGYVPKELVPNRPRQYKRRQLQQSGVNDPTPVSELFQGFGTHYVDLWCGTPEPQRQTVIVDTGSAVTAFPCSGCNDCGVPKYHSDALFEEKNSSTFETLQCDSCLKGRCWAANDKRCRISMSYAEGSSWTAFEARDSCFVGGVHSKGLKEADLSTDNLDPFHAPAFKFPLCFGCQTHLTGLFITQVSHDRCTKVDGGRLLLTATFSLPLMYVSSCSSRMVSWEWTMPRRHIGSKCSTPGLLRKKPFHFVLRVMTKCPGVELKRVP